MRARNSGNSALDDAGEQPCEIERAQESATLSGFPARAVERAPIDEPLPEYERLKGDPIDRGWITVLNGPVGTGKTQMATRYAMHRWIRAARMGQRRSMVYTTGIGLHHAISPDPRYMTERCKATRFLIIDEFDAVKKDSDWYLTHLREILKHRTDAKNDYGNGLDTLLITNLTSGALKAVLDRSVYDIACGRGAVYTIEGGSRR